MLRPLVGVGPLLFGMSPGEVRTVLGGAAVSASRSWAGRLSWQRYRDVGVTAIYGVDERLAAVAVDALTGPLVRLGDVGLIARVPSEVRADVHELARRDGESVRVNWSGDPEVAAWGLSMGAAREQKDAMLTEALLVGPGPADDPYGTEPVIRWRDVRDWEKNPGAWPVAAEEDRPRWDWTPLVGVGPLRFGMRPEQVAAALHGEEPTTRRGQHRAPKIGAGEWRLDGERFEEAGVTTHYSYLKGVPTLAAVTVLGRTGPQVEFEGIRLIGRTVSTLEAALVRHLEDRGIDVVVGCGEDLELDGLGLYVRAVRAGDTVISEARFCEAEWEDHG
ncbi:hypothetical protein ACFV4F_23215 [Kitasatospora sp. NPDC059722]|uniref:hypothetical protein n=1 Tax=Kitasatospora sp. NPDC059722 TaxID=3346925 RepID=UPI0036A495D2